MSFLKKERTFRLGRPLDDHKMGKSRAVSPRVGLAQVGGIGLPGELATIKRVKKAISESDEAPFGRGAG